MRYFFITLVLYSLLLIPFKFIFAMIPGYEMKMITFFPAVLGIFWGPMVAFGVAGANFLVDMLARNELYIALTSSIAMFFQAYIPFKLWYTFRCREEERYFFIHDMKSVAKFIYIISLTSLTVSAMFGMIIESSRLSFSQETFWLFFLNNFDFALVFGIPILIVLANSNIRRYQPVYDSANFIPQPMYDGYLYLVLAAGFIYLFVIGQGIPVSGTMAFATWSVMFIFMVLFAQKPIICDDTEELTLNRQQLLDGMVKKYVMLGFFLGVVLLCLSVLLFAYLTLERGVFVDNIKAWQSLGMVLFTGIHILFIIALAMMYMARRRLKKIFAGDAATVIRLHELKSIPNEQSANESKQDFK